MQQNDTVPASAARCPIAGSAPSPATAIAAQIHPKPTASRMCSRIAAFEYARPFMTARYFSSRTRTSPSPN